MTIKKQLLYTIILATLIPMIVMPWIGYFYIRNVVEEQLLLQSKQQLEEITRDMEDMLDDILKVSNVVVVDEELMSIIKSENDTVQNQYEIIKKLSNLNGAYLYRYNAAICIYSKFGHIYSTLGAEQDENADFRTEWNEETIENKNYFLWKTFPDHSADEPVLGMSRTMYDSNGKMIGTLCIEIFSDQYLSRLLRQDSDFRDTERYLVDEQGNFILEYTNNSEQSYYTEQSYKEYGMENIGKAVLKGTEKYIFLQKTINKTGWKMIQIVPYNEVFAKLNYYRNFTFLSNIICLAILLVIDNYTANKIGKAFIHLGKAMKQVRQGNFIKLENHEKNIEVRQIYDDFNNMSTKLEILFEENQRIAREKEECRFLALQTQIQPHFLFNTLNGIKWLCIIESAPTAERMIESLGYILEYSLGKTKDCITLDEEIVCLKHYVELQKMRYGNTFDVIYEIDENLTQLQVPVLILQPLVENCIIHGIREKEERGKIVIKAEEKEGEIIISVEDNGVGMSEAWIRQVLEGIGTTGSIGVVNVKERIELYYKESKFLIISEEGKGTAIQIKLRTGENVV